jgi:formylglycine-generating enzyme required for sulfatase activity
MSIACGLVAWLATALGPAAPAQGAAAQAQDGARGIAVEGERDDEPARSSYRRRHALVVGIDTYEDPRYPDLAYAAADARAVAGLLVERYGFRPEDVRLILDQDATRAALAEALDEWICDRARVGEDDLVVFFFAGHGATRDLEHGPRGYLVPVDGRPEGWGDLIGMNLLEDVSEAIPAKHALFVLDCCFGGLAVKRSAPPLAAGLGSRARQVITGGGAEQVVLDGGGGGHSVFTGALLEALSGAADHDGDGVIAFGELYGHVGREVERRTEGRQTPLQATFRDHSGGNVALFAPGIVPGGMTAAERLRALERTDQERLAELERLKDAIVVQDLLAEAEELWPEVPAMVPRYRSWLARAREVLARLPQHQASLRLVRQEAYLGQVLAGGQAEGEDGEPEWEHVDPELRWRFETFAKLVHSLERLALVMRDVEGRLALAPSIQKLSIEDHAAEWDDAIRSIAALPVYAGLALAPQVGLVPLGPDPRSGLWEFAHVRTGEVPARGPDGELALAESSALVLVLIPGGAFDMGAQARDPAARNYDPQAFQGEGPVRRVAVEPFFIGKHELTQGQWSRFTGSNPSGFYPGSRFVPTPITLLHPVEQIDWEPARRTLEHLGLALPTESQWEYAARAGTQTVWWTGDEKESLRGAVNLADRTVAVAGLDWPSTADWPDLDDGYISHAPVDHYRPNAFGLHNVHGNVAEWCADEPPAETDEPVGEVEHCSRGGNFKQNARVARSASRVLQKAYAGEVIGVRPARAIE